MNSWKYIAVISLAIFYLCQCSEDFQLTEPYKDISVIYGIINRSDTAQYFRIEKGFVDENIPASTIAQNADSLYYPNPTVKLYNLTSKKEYTLIKVDGNLEGYQRGPGPFATAPNYLYKLLTLPKDSMLKAGDSVKIELKRTDNAVPVTARIALVNDLKFIIPDPGTQQLNFIYGATPKFQWQYFPNTSTFDLKAHVFIEVYKNSTLRNLDTIVIPFNNSIHLDGLFGTAVVDGSSFYIFFHDKLSPETGVEHHIDHIDFYLTGGGPEIDNYNVILNANTGITASQEIPRFTNIYEGSKKAFGIFSSIVTITKRITPDPRTIDSLQVNPLTRDLHFIR